MTRSCEQNKPLVDTKMFPNSYMPQYGKQIKSSENYYLLGPLLCNSAQKIKTKRGNGLPRIKNNHVNGRDNLFANSTFMRTLS